MMTYARLLKEGKEFLQKRQIPDGDLDAWYLLEYLIRKDRSWYFLHMNEQVEDGIQREYQGLLERRGKHVPLQQITGKAYFMGLEFTVNEHVLIPRQDTEILVEEALKRMQGSEKILDLCTGSGCILLSLLYNNKRACGTGVDISKDALAVAEENSGALGIKAQWIESDLWENVTEQYDLILSNPPYIPTKVIDGLMEEVRIYEPHLALDGGSDGLDFYRQIVSHGATHLRPGGWLLMEIGQEQGNDLRRLLEEKDYEEIEVVKDLAGLDRVVIGRTHQEEIHV